MNIVQERVTCQACGNVFEAELVMNAPIAVACAAMKAVRCTKCGCGNVGLGGSYDDAPQLSAPIEHRAQWWKDRGEVGSSSETIWSVFVRGPLPRRVSIPLDPDDFRRCKLLFDLLPEWRADLQTLTKALPWYQPHVDRWDEFDRLYAKESPSGSCEALDHLLKNAEVESLRIRYPKAKIRTNENGHLSSMVNTE